MTKQEFIKKCKQMSYLDFLKFANDTADDLGATDIYGVNSDYISAMLWCIANNKKRPATVSDTDYADFCDVYDCLINNGHKIE